MVNKRAFVDTNGLLALLNRDDPLFPEADSRWREMGHTGYSLFLTDWIIAETGNGLARTSLRYEFVEAVARLRRSPRVNVISVSTRLMESTLKLYAERVDKTWGLVDCASFTLMANEA